MIELHPQINDTIQRIWHSLRRFWYWIAAGVVIGGVGAAIYCFTVQPLYKTQLRFFTWNQTVAEAAREISNTVNAEDANKTQAVIMYNNLISQSMVIGQSLVNDYKLLLENPSVAGRVREKLGADAKYEINITAKRQSCIIVIEGISPSPEMAQMAANTTMAVFQEEQSRLMGVNFASIIKEAPLPESAFFPNWKKIIPLGLLVGFSLGAGVAFLLDYLDFSFKTPEELEAQNLPFLGRVSALQNVSKELDLSVYHKERCWHVLEDELVSIKTNLRHRNIENPQHTIMITGDMPSTGKSTMAIWLAQMLADPEKKTLLLDCDLRKPSLSRNLKRFPKGGFVDCMLAIAENGTVDDFIAPTGFTGVDFMSNGQIPRRPNDFFESAHFDTLLKQLQQKYRYVIIDSPPGLNMADAFLIAQHVDGVIFVAEYGKSRIDHYARLLKQWAPLKGKILGAILTKCPNHFASYYYYGEHSNRN